MKKARKVQFCSILTVALMSSSSYGIAIRHDVSPSNYDALAASYDSVAMITGDGFLASGSLVSPTKFLTAAHFIDANKDGTPDAGLNYTIRFGPDYFTDFSHEITSFSSVSVHPNYNGGAQYDLAVLTFSTPFSALDPMQISNQDPTGLTGTMVGYGQYGTGDNFAASNEYERHAAQNVIDRYGTTVRTDFDSPAEDTSSFGSAVPLGLEGTTAGGDSGGPLIVNFGSGDRIVGALHGGSNSFGASSEYGDVSIWATMSDPDNMAYLEGEGLTLVPEPATWGTLLFCAFYLVRRRVSRV